jgi:hypothetical protein
MHDPSHSVRQALQRMQSEPFSATDFSTRNWNFAATSGSSTTSGKSVRGCMTNTVWTNCYHVYPAGAAFGGYKISGVGRENHRMMLDEYSEVKNLLVSYSPRPLGLF